MDVYTPAFALGPVCDSPETCSCAVDVTGRSDWINAEGYLCQINYWAVFTLWLIQLFLWSFLFIVSLPKFAQLYQRFFSTEKKRSNTCFEIPPALFVVILLFSTVMPCVFAVGLLRMLDQNERIGITPTITFLWLICRFLFFGSVAIYQPALIRRTLRAENSTRPFIRFYTILNFILCSILGLSGLLILPVYLSPVTNIPLSRAYFGLFLGINFFCLMLHYLMARSVDQKLLTLLMDSYTETRNEAILTLREKLHHLQTTAKRTSLFQSVFYLIWLLCPPLWSIHDYLLPITWLSFIAMAHASLNSIYIREKEKYPITVFQRGSKTETTIEANRNSSRYAGGGGKRGNSLGPKIDSIRFASPPIID